MENENQKTTPIKAIKAKCIDCCCGVLNEVKLCPCEDCSLYPFRLGHNPNRKGRELTEEQKKEIGKRLQASKNKKNPL